MLLSLEGKKTVVASQMDFQMLLFFKRIFISIISIISLMHMWWGLLNEVRGEHEIPWSWSHLQIHVFRNKCS